MKNYNGGKSNQTLMDNCKEHSFHAQMKNVAS